MRVYIMRVCFVYVDYNSVKILFDMLIDFKYSGGIMKKRKGYRF